MQTIFLNLAVIEITTRPVQRNVITIVEGKNYPHGVCSYDVER